MLRGDHYGIYPLYLIVVVFHGHLRFSVRPQIRQRAVLPHLRQPSGQSVGQRYGQRHHLRSLVAGKAEHHTLISGSRLIGHLRFIGKLPVLIFQRLVYSHGYIRRLFIYGGHYRAHITVKSIFTAVVPYVTDHISGQLLYIDIAFCAYFPHDHRVSGINSRLCRHTSLGILFHYGIHYGIRYLIADLIGMSLGYRFRCK